MAWRDSDVITLAVSNHFFCHNRIERQFKVTAESQNAKQNVKQTVQGRENEL